MLVVHCNLQAQSSRDRAKFHKAMQLQSRSRYAQAAKLHEKYLLKSTDWESKWNLALCYGKLGQIDDRERLLTDLVFSKPDEPDFQLELAELLKRQGKYEAAKTWFEKYAERGPDSVAARRQAGICADALVLRKDSLGYQVGRISGVNSAQDDVLPYLEGNALFFVSGRSGKPALWRAPRAADGSLGKPMLSKVTADGLSKGMNMSLADGLKPSASKAAASLASSTLAGTQGISQVCVSPNGKFKISAFELKDGFGGMDLYVAYWENGSWTPFANLGAEVNSAANEAFPYLSSDSILFFSSDRSEGMGGYDIYAAECFGEHWFNVRHEGAPLNSSFDDFGLCMLAAQPQGYFASNRPGGMGGSDVMNFRRFKVVEAQVVDADSYLPLPGTRVEVIDINQQHHIYKTDAEGRFKHVVRAGQELFAQLFHADYHDLNQNITVRFIGFDQNLRVTIPMDPIKRHVLQGVVTDAKTKVALEGVTVRLVGQKDFRSLTGRKGSYTQVLQPATYYRAIYYLQGYVPQILEFTTGTEATPQTLTQNVALRKGGFHYLEGRAVDTERDIVVGGATIHFLDGKTLAEQKTQTVGPDGMFFKVLEADQDYTIIASKGKYLSARMVVPAATDRADTLLSDMALVPLMPDKVIKTVYFPYKSSTIDEAGFRDVAEVVYLLKSNPNIGLELSAFTDARGGANYNKLLSQKRADALAAYIAAQGIEPSRIKSFGRGEEQLFNNCSDGVNCSEELHGQNRRAEIRIVRM